MADSGQPKKISLSLNELENKRKITPAKAKRSEEKPRSIREIKQEKEKEKQQDQAKIIITNISKQLIKIHLNAPKGVDFYLGAEDKELYPGRTGTFKKSRVRMGQIDRLKKMGQIAIVADTEKAQEEDQSKKVTIIK